MGKKVGDGDILRAMEMMVDYESTVYGFKPNYHNYSLSYMGFDEHSLDEKEGKMFIDESFDERLSDESKEYLKNALWLWYV